ncbi:NYN domain-containing protein [Nonomuraea sp. PA05]|uniref:NYN domain-containing protein n=1 Tax=Nonomuraea sp. PA05 TaxID=2604466 RepID=UPI0011DBB1B2|nr:NYN domain-containing protein [Nonomuraea sp. PA05]TYB55363.1 NYN domain-containing protein [Nonomuraea sp. PA05]
MRRIMASWPRWAGYAAAGWSLGYGALGLFWALGGAGFPFGRSDPDWEPGLSVLGDASGEVAAPLIAVLGLLGGVAGVASARGVRWGRPVLLGFSWVAAAVLTVVVPDNRVLMVVAYAPLLVVFLFTGVPGGQPMAELVPWSRINLFVVLAGGLLWALAALAYQRRTAGRCAACGRGSHGTAGSGGARRTARWGGSSHGAAGRGGPRRAAGWATPQAARRWGVWAVVVAAAIPAGYDASRFAWAAGLPLGITEEFWQWLDESGLRWAGLFLSLMGLGGAILTLGLAQRWGEVYPRWIWFRAGRPVPPMLAVVPASVVSVIVFSGGLTFWRLRMVHDYGWDMWATWAPSLLWPLWGVALAAATLAYHLRRRGACRACGLGGPPAAQPAGRA